MEFLTQLFGLFDYLTEVSSILMAVSGVLATHRGYRAAGTLIAFGGAFLFLGRTTMFLATQFTPFTDLLVSLMFPGFFLFAAGICLLVWQIPKR